VKVRRFEVERSCSAEALVGFKHCRVGPLNSLKEVNAGMKASPEGRVDEGRVWLLPHPGVERSPKNGENVCPWPEGDRHGRKFLQVDGCAIMQSGQRAHGDMCVWAEYEAPTHARPVDAKGRGPRFVQTPLITVGFPEMNTDPWIFHPGFVWSICKHKAEWQSPPEPGGPRQPLPGDMVLFGSPVQNSREQWDWVLDTVVVVKRRLSGPTAGILKNSYGKLVEPALRGQTDPLPLPFVGQPHDSAAHYSFAPCKPAAEGKSAYFERPSISALFAELRLDHSGKRPSPASAMALSQCRPEAGMDEFWKALTQLIWTRELALGVDFDLPAIRVLGPGATAAVPDSEVKSAPRRKRSRAA